MYLEYGSLLSIITLYSFYLKKNKQTNLIISLFLLIIFSKLFFIYLEYINFYINHFTIRDESTFIEETKKLNKNSNLSIFLIGPGDYFLYYILNLFYTIFKTDISIKLVPVVFSIITFHYSYKLAKILQFKEIYIFFFILLLFFWPSNFLFNYSATKEFLQTTFLICVVYYSFRLFTKINIFIFLKYFIFLLLFSYSHRGFEVIAVIHTASLLSLITLSKIQFKFTNLLNLVFISLVSVIFIFIILIFFGSLDNFTQKIISSDFIEWYNNQRVSNEVSANNYTITIESLSFKNIILLFFKTSLYYFFYLPNISNYFYIYYLFEITLTYLFIIITFLVLLFRNYLKFNLPSFSVYKVLLLIILYLTINFGFAFFNSNIGNAIRHKTISFFIVFLMLTFFYILTENLISKFSIKKLNNNYNQRG